MTNISSADDQPRQAAREDDGVRDAITWQDNTTYSMTLAQVYARFVEVGLGRSLRTLQRFCQQGHLRAAKYPTDTGAVWYVDPESVETKIEEIRQVQEVLQRQASPSGDAPPTTVADMSQLDAARRRGSTSELDPDTSDAPTAADNDEPRHEFDDAARRASGNATVEPGNSERRTASDGDGKYVTVPVVMIDALTEQLVSKDEQITRRDIQIERLVESHDKDRQLLGAALAIIHNDDFPMELGGGEHPTRESDAEQAEEIKPEFEHDGGNASTGHGADNV